MTLGAATDYLELSLLSAAMGYSAGIVVPSAWWLHISTTEPADDGTGVTPFSGDTYVPRQVTAWGAVTDDDDGAGHWTKIWVKPTAVITFPTPTIEWWPAGTTIYPYLTDNATAGAGHVLWRWKARVDTIDPTNPLIFDPADARSSGGMIQIGVEPAGAFARKEWYRGAFARVVKNDTSYTGPPALWLAMTNAGHKEPSDSSYPHGGDAAYTRRPLTAFSAPALGLLGVAEMHCTDAFTWDVTSGQSSDPAIATAWDTNMTAEVYDNAGVSSGTLWFAFTGGNARPHRGDTFAVPTNQLTWMCT